MNFAACLQAYDNDGNGFSDVWERFYEVDSLDLNGDADFDGFSNQEESVSGTNPFDRDDKPSLALGVNLTAEQTELNFETIWGKHYTVWGSKDLNSFAAMHVFDWVGDGASQQVALDQSGVTERKSLIRADFWANITGDLVESLSQLATFPSNPDGTAYQNEPVAPSFLATGYGARITARITPPESGDFTFYLSSGGPAELYLRNQATDEDASLLAYVLQGQAGLSPLEWSTYETQQSGAITLEAGTPYLIELRYVATAPRQHVQIGWSGPSLEGIELLDRNALATEPMLNRYVPPVSLLAHDYDSSGQTNALWPANTALESGSAFGFSGNGERMSDDPGNSNAERIDFAQTSSDHLYATWLFNMRSGHNDANLAFINGTNLTQEGPRINMEERSNGTVASVRGGGSSGVDSAIEVTFGDPYRVEIVSTVADEGFAYATPNGSAVVAKDTFDLYVSDLNRNLIGSAQGLSFRDGGSDVVQGFSAVYAIGVTDPDIIFDEWEVTSGQIQGSGFLIPNHVDLVGDDWSHFFRLSVDDSDQDGDGITDSEELSLAEFHKLLFFDSTTVDGVADTTTLQNLLDGFQGEPEVMLFSSDNAAFESNYPNTIPDDATITVTRSGSLAPLEVELCILPLVETGNTTLLCTAMCCILQGSAGDEEAEPEDYEIRDAQGNLITDSLNFAFGEMTKVLTLKAVNDGINEYPETVNIALTEPEDERYGVSPTIKSASIQLFDLPDSPDNVAIFTGTFSQDGNAVVPSSGSGFVTATINGPRTEMRFWNEFSGLTSNQQDSHIHKAGAGNTPGDIIYAITNTPGDESGDSPDSDPLLGPLTDYPWDLAESSGAISTSGGGASKQVIIDSLFGQNGETGLYLNIHTVDNPAGEIWAFFNLSGGSVTDPGDAPSAAAPGSVEYPQLTGDLLESEVRRFLNQATFGATDSEVAFLLNKIETERVSDPDYHRNAAFSDWLDDQMDPDIYGQTYLLEFTLAGHWQFMTLAGLFDPLQNPSDGTTPTPTRPSTWPTFDRSSDNPAHIYLNQTYPITFEDIDLAEFNGLRAQPGNNQRRHAHWQAMLNGRDQLRQKMGYALQQIVVVSVASAVIQNVAYSAANYQDLINTYAFSHYRDVLGFVNWSPVMGKWLSSLQNQKAIDFDGDGVFDTYPDENLARENMQLFSIGLFQTWSDGTLRLSSEGLPQSTYTNDDIREFAKVLTGQSFSRYNGFRTTWGGVPYAPDNEDFNTFSSPSGLFREAFLYPMKMFGDYHSLGPKTFAGVTIDNSAISDPTQQGEADIEAAMDWLAGKPGDGLPDFDMVNSHISTPAFIAQRLIQRFTTSNPSREYLHRVATVFKNTEGDLGFTIKAILLDPEARVIDLDNTVFGQKKSPLEGYFQLLRSLGGHTHVPLYNPEGAAPYDVAGGDFSNPDLYLENFEYPLDQIANQERNIRFLSRRTITASSRGLQMDPFRQDTVFNFYLPNYSPGGIIGESGLVAPEMQLANEPDIIRNINYFEDIIRSTLGPSADELGGTNETQIAAFNSNDAIFNDYHRLSRQELADAFYPATEPTPTGGRNSHSLANEAMLDELDKRLTYGFFKMRYPYDPTDDDDPNVAGVDDLLKNPRELIIDAITTDYNHPYDGNNDASDRLYKFSDALYLLTFSPEYQIKK